MFCNTHGEVPLILSCPIESVLGVRHAYSGVTWVQHNGAPNESHLKGKYMSPQTVQGNFMAAW